MLRKLLLSVFICLSLIPTLYAQTQGGALKVKVVDGATKETIPFATVVVESGGSQVTYGQTDINGEAFIKPIAAGKYDVKILYTGYTTVIINNIIIAIDKTSYQEISMKTGVDLKAVEVVEYKVPLIDPDTKTGGTVTREQFQNMATKSINSVAATTAGVFQATEGAALNIRGSRSNNTAYYVDGVKVIGGLGIPSQGVEQVTTIIGGTPAQYGDVAAGVVSVTTREPSNNYAGNAELISSRLTDDFNYNSLGFAISGPLYKKKDTTTQSNKSILGFFIAGDVTYQPDPTPSAIGYYKVKDDVLERLEKQPLRKDPLGGSINNGEFIRMSDLEKIKVSQNTAQTVVRLQGKLNYKPYDNFYVTLGGSLLYTAGNNGGGLFTFKNTTEYKNTNWNVYGKITQKFGSQTVKEGEKSSLNIKNAFYTLQADYQQVNSVTQSERHKEDIFKYGHIGKFKYHKMPVYNTIKGQDIYLSGYRDTAITFEPGPYNPDASVYTSQVYEFQQNNIVNDFQIQNNLGLINGTGPRPIYSIYGATGNLVGGRGFSEASQFRVVTSFSADIKNHSILAGIEYEQRIERAYSIQAAGLWQLMKLLANSHIRDLDTTNPIFNPILSSGDLGYKFYDYNRKVEPGQKFFDKSLREKLGLPVNGTDFIDVDSYDPNFYSIDMFSADDLINSGQSFVSYYGYDHTGERLNSNPSFDDYFTKKDAKGNFVRGIGAFQPIYVAGYIQDKFDFKDVKFNIGLRVDRYDANQKVLKDKYSLYEVKTAGEVTNLGEHPGNIGKDYVVYVNDLVSPTAILGYRNGDTWYDSKGVQVVDPNVLALNSATGRIIPYLVNPSDNINNNITSKSFKDYVPQVNFMPRIAFAFPISDVANFYAHYDILTQRPFANRLDPSIYLFPGASFASGGILSNPDLKPEQTIDYELGFRQVLTERKNSAIEFSAFYKEIRNQQQTIKVVNAFPSDYLTTGNIDFSTVKGVSLTYDYRRTGNTGIQFKTSYTLQFANGSGSSATSGAGLAASGVPNLRVLVPLDFDSRHAIVMNVDYRFGEGTDYNGPNWRRKKGDSEKTHQLLKNMGANLTIQANSGTPYSAQVGPSATAIIGSINKGGIKGSVNGARLPWQFRMDLRIDKNFELKWDKKDGSGKKTTYLNAYVAVLNLLDNLNIVGVYPYSGVAYDDGYLTSAIAQPTINAATDPQSFKDLYSVRINAPGAYSFPRRIRLGVLYSF